jgi:dienelactone hydrolase
VFETMEPVEFDHEGTRLRGSLARPDADGPMPAILVMHSALGVAHVSWNGTLTLLEHLFAR